MVTQFRAPENTILQTDGGTLATAVEKDVLVEWVKSIEVWDTPLYNAFISNDEWDQSTLQWGQSFRIATRTFLDDVSGISPGATSVTVDTGDGALFQVGMVIEIADPMPSTTDIPDLTDTSQAVVTGITGDTLTTTPISGTYSDDAIITIIGTAEEQNSFHSEAPRQRGTRLFNYFQRFNAKNTADIRAQNQSTWEHPSNPLLADFAEEMKKQKLLMERAIYAGKRVKEVPGTPGRFGGLREFITTNAEDQSGAALTIATFDDIVSDLWYEVGNSAATKIVGSLNTMRIIDQLLEPDRQATVSDEEIRFGIRRYKTRVGTFDFMQTRECPESELWLLNFDEIKLRPFKGANWHVTEKAGKDNAVDHDVKAISGDFSLQVNNEKAMARIYNFDTRISTYTS